MYGENAREKEKKKLPTCVCGGDGLTRKLTGQSKTEEMDEDDKDEGGGGSGRAGGQQHQQRTATLQRRPPVSYLGDTRAGAPRLASPRAGKGAAREAGQPAYFPLAPDPDKRS